jgi:hypothetical protein
MTKDHRIDKEREYESNMGKQMEGYSYKKGIKERKTEMGLTHHL